MFCCEADIAPSSSASTACPTDVASLAGAETVGESQPEGETLDDDDAMMEALENQTELELKKAIAAEQAALDSPEVLAPVAEEAVVDPPSIQAPLPPAHPADEQQQVVQTAADSPEG